MHARQQIRDAVATAVTGLPLTGSNVFKTRMEKVEELSHPALLIYTLSEDSERETMGIRTLVRALRVAIQISVLQPDDIDAAIDDIAEDVEQAIETAIVGGSGVWGVLRDFVLDSSVITMSGEGAQRALGMVLTYTAVYRTVEGAPETIIA